MDCCQPIDPLHNQALLLLRRLWIYGVRAETRGRCEHRQCHAQHHGSHHQLTGRTGTVRRQPQPEGQADRKECHQEMDHGHPALPAGPAFGADDRDADQ